MIVVLLSIDATESFSVDKVPKLRTELEITVVKTEPERLAEVVQGERGLPEDPVMLENGAYKVDNPVDQDGPENNAAVDKNTGKSNLNFHGHPAST